jgi:hypothetical protein
MLFNITDVAMTITVSSFVFAFVTVMSTICISSLDVCKQTAKKGVQ